jgi:transglutaminase-like putative cysteine protease
LLADFAWANFGGVSGGWARVQAICDFVHGRLRFSYPEARPTRTANEALAEGVGVCRDFTHLAIALCRCLNIPARYCNGYLGDIGVPIDLAPMDLAPGLKPLSAAPGYVRRSTQSPAHWPDIDRKRPGRGRCRD